MNDWDLDIRMKLVKLTAMRIPQRFTGHILFLGMMLTHTFLAIGQETRAKGSLALNAYIDTYYGIFSDDLPLNTLQKYTTVSPIDNQFGINTIQLGINYTHDRIRGALTLHYGDIAKATWSEDYQQVQEGWAGVRLLKDLWLDAGFFITHVGTESFLPKNNWTSSTTVATYIGPFYQSGARLSWEGSERLHAEFYVINGYNQFLDRNRAKSYGALLSYQLSPEIALTYSNMLGRESEENAAQDQYLFYHNLYAQWSPGKLKVIAGTDYAWMTNAALDQTDKSARMINALTVLRYSFSTSWSATARFEMYRDTDGFLSGVWENNSGELQGLEMTGYTLSMEYTPIENAFLRAETWYIQTEEALDIFTDESLGQNQRWEFMFTLGFYLEEWKVL